MPSDTDANKARFVKGILLTWIPLLLFMGPTLVTLFQVISYTRATGIAAVAGGLTGSLAIVGIVAMVVSQALAIVLLARTFERGHILRSLFSALSMGCSLLLLSLMAVFIWGLSRSTR